MIIYLSLFMCLKHIICIMHCLSPAQDVVDSLSLWWADDTTGYYAELEGEEIPEDPQPAKEEREWCTDYVE